MLQFSRATIIALCIAAAAGLFTTTAHAGSVTIYNGGGYNQPTCREFTSTINVGNMLQQGVGTACLQGDGSWQIVSGPGVGSSFFDNGIPVAYPANNYVINTYPQPVYYQQPVRVRYIFAGPRNFYRPAPVIVTRGPGWGGPPYGYGRPYHGWDYDRRHGDGRNHHH
jgi:hypothetical protein